MSPAQLAMLRIIEHWGGDGSGWCEIELQFACERGIPDYLEASTSVRVCDALVRQGMIVKHADGPVITDAGKAFLAGTR